MLKLTNSEKYNTVELLLMEAMKVKECREMTMEGFGGRKRKGEMI